MPPLARPVSTSGRPMPGSGRGGVPGGLIPPGIGLQLPGEGVGMGDGLGRPGTGMQGGSGVGQLVMVGIGVGSLGGVGVGVGIGHSCVGVLICGVATGGGPEVGGADAAGL